MELIGIGGLPLLNISGDFLQVTGLNMEFNFETYTQGGSTETQYLYSGISPQTLVLERGVIDSQFTDVLVYALVATRLGCTVKMGGEIIMRNPNGEKLRSWSVAGARPVKYIGPSLDSNKSFIAVERIEFVYNGAM